MKQTITILLATVSISAGAEIVASFPSPSSDITGLAYEDESLWCMDTEQKTVYRLNPATGNVLFSSAFDCFYEPFGLAASNDTLFFCMIKAGGPTTYYGLYEPYSGSGQAERLDLC